MEMKLGVMPGDTIPAQELKTEGFDGMQLFWGMGEDAESKDPTTESIDETLTAGDLALTAMTLHIDLVGPAGLINEEVEREEEKGLSSIQKEKCYAVFEYTWYYTHVVHARIPVAARVSNLPVFRRGMGFSY